MHKICFVGNEGVPSRYRIYCLWLCCILSVFQMLGRDLRSRSYSLSSGCGNSTILPIKLQASLGHHEFYILE